MLRRGPGDQSGGGGGGGEKGGALEAGVAEINNSVCSAMLGMVLSDEALRDFHMRQKATLSGKLQDKKFGQGSVDVSASGMGNKQSHSSEAEQEAGPRLPHTAEAEDAEVAEVPPPMRPISSLPAPEDASKKRDPGPDWNGLNSSSEAGLGTRDLETETAAEAETEAADPNNCDPKEHSSGDTAAQGGDPVAKAIEQRSYRLQEILESERMYVTDLEQVYTYLAYMRESKETEDADIPMPEELRQGRDRMIFGNIESIYEWHRDYFSKNLEKCIENPMELGNLFKKSEKKFQMYVVYCQNKPKSEFIVSAHIDTYFEEIRLKYGFKLRLTDLLIKPIQRLTKYHMLLEAILKHSQRAGFMDEAAAIEQAFQVMTVVPNQANDMMDIGRLQGFEGKIVAQGKLLLHGPLLCTDDPPSGPSYKLKEMTVFLFEQIIIFADTVGKKTQFTSPVYVYKAHIQVNKMQFEERVEGDPENRMFRVKSTCPKGPAITYFCQADNTAARNIWTGTMAKQLQTQKEFLQALQAPIAYHNKRMKELSETDLNRHWEINASLSPPLGRTQNGVKPMSISHNTLEQNLSIEDAFDRAMSLPSSPTVKTAEDSFDSFEEEHCVGKPRSSSEKARRERQPGTGASSGSSPAVSGAGRKTFLNGFKIRGRTKSGENFSADKADSGVTGGSQSDEKLNSQHSTKQGQAELGPLGMLTVGSVAAVMIDYRAVREDEVSVAKGDLVTVVASNLSRGYLVHRAAVTQVSPGAEGWIPSYCLHLAGAASKKPSSWAFKIRKQSAPRLGRQDSSPGLALGRAQPGFIEHLNNVAVTVGESACFSCRLEGGAAPSVVWKGPGGGLLQAGGRVRVTSEDAVHSLALDSCSLEDAGEYYCILATEEGSVSSQARLTVSHVPSPPGQPRVQDLRGSRAVVSWERGDTAASRVFSLQMCRLATGHWATVRDNLAEGLCIVDSLVQGETYSFRVVSHAPGTPALVSEPSPPSPPLTVPLADISCVVAPGLGGAAPPTSSPAQPAPSQLLDPAWRPDFELQYIELEEVGRGRRSVVRRCQEILTGREVAVKFVNRRQQSRGATRREYEALRKLSHPNIVSASGLFVTASSDAIVMDLVFGPPLLDWLCEAPSYSEAAVGRYMTQLLGALAHLHHSKIIHLDLRPENLVLEADNKTLRLIDFGEAQPLQTAGVGGNMAAICPDSGAEFLPPETISRGPVGVYTDMWCFGVILYILLSGISPFMDDSEEETINNILRCDVSLSCDQLKASPAARDLVRRLLVVNPCQRISAASCLGSAWVRGSSSSAALLSSRHLASFVARRKKRLSSLGSGGFTRIPRPESMYKKLPS